MVGLVETLGRPGAKLISQRISMQEQGRPGAVLADDAAGPLEKSPMGTLTGRGRVAASSARNACAGTRLLVRVAAFRRALPLPPPRLPIPRRTFSVPSSAAPSGPSAGSASPPTLSTSEPSGTARSAAAPPTCTTCEHRDMLGEHLGTGTPPLNATDLRDSTDLFPPAAMRPPQERQTRQRATHADADTSRTRCSRKYGPRAAQLVERGVRARLLRALLAPSLGTATGARPPP